ncbi:ATP-grasp domain-containing protein [soil metagenome]
MSFNIVVSSAGRRVALLRLFRRALRDLGHRGQVIATDMSPLSSAAHEAERFFQVPPCTDPGFVPAMLDVCARTGARLLVPTIDPELAVYARHRERFAEVGTTVAVSGPQVVGIGADKRETHAWLTRAGIPTVRQGTVDEVLADPDDWPFPLMVKPRQGSAGVGVEAVADPDDLKLASCDGDPVVQTVARGREHTIDMLVDRTGGCVCAVPRRRIEVRAGESSKGVTVRCPVLEATARRVCAALPDAYGALNLQLFRDAGTGETSVIELNPRFGGGFPLSWEAGGRFPEWMISELLGREPVTSPSGWRGGVVMLRYDDAVFVDARTVGLPDAV